MKKDKFVVKLYDALLPVVDLWISDGFEAYVDVSVGNVKVTYLIDSIEFDGWVRHFAREHMSDVSLISTVTVKEVIKSLQSEAVRRRNMHPITVRVGSLNNKVYYDMADGVGTVFEIDADGWRKTENCPIKFYRPKFMQEQVVPKKGGDLTLLKKYLNFRTEDDAILLISWLLACMNTSKEFPVLIINGGQGTAKSTITQALRKIIDPSGMPAFQPPKDVRDLVAYAKNSFVLPIDNLSFLPAWLSDDFCRLALGSSGLGGRGLYTNSDLASFKASRPIILNGIPEIVERNDLGERAIQLTLPKISDEARLSEEEYWENFNRDLPLIIGVVFDMVAAALSQKGKYRFAKLPRMAGFASFVGGAASLFGKTPDEWMEIYKANRYEGDAGLVEGNVVAQALFAFMSKEKTFQGSFALLTAKLMPYRGVHDKNWPDSEQKFRNEFKRLQPVLESYGIKFYKHGREGGTGRTMIQLELVNEEIKCSATP